MKQEKIREFFLAVGPVKLILAGICGIFLILTGTPGWGNEKPERDGETERKEEVYIPDENEAYIKKTEKRLREALEEVRGAGRTRVMITLSASKEAVLNKDRSYRNETETEEAGNVDRKEEQEKTVSIKKDGDEIPYVIKEYEPQIEGVVVIMEGGDDPVLVNQVTEAIQALFYLDVHKIKVLKMEDHT